MRFAEFQSKLQNRILDINPPSNSDSLGLMIYHNAYRGRLRDTLADTFERVYKYLGEKQFATLAGDFVEQSQSEHYSLAQYGRAFPDWLAKHQSAPLAGLAMIDWRMHECFTSGNASTLSASDLCQIEQSAWADVIFHVVPSATLLTTNRLAIDCWTAIETNRHIELESCDDFSEQTALIWRKGFNPMMRVLKDEEVEATKRLLGRESFASICQSFKALDANQAPQLAGKLLAQWLSDGMLCSFEVCD
ncbi:MAG: DNA-binding domain-containing protein [Limnobacter sp.]|nr:DNA-binding domain-containing protein [Limnobacter sp.]